MTALQTTPAVGDNGLEGRRKAAFKEAEAFGNQTASGADAYPNLYMKAALWASDGVLTLDKDSDKSDDAKRLYAAYRKGYSSKAKHTKDGIKNAESKLRQVMFVASQTQNIDFVSTIDEIVKVRDEAGKADPKVVKPLALSIYDAAQLQKKQDTDLTAEQIKSVVMKETREQTVEGKLKVIFSALDKLVTGEGGLHHPTDNVTKARELIGAEMAMFTFTRKRDELGKMAAELGLTVSE